MYEKKSKENEKAGALASQALGSIKTVMAFNGQFRELSRYFLPEKTRFYGFLDTKRYWSSESGSR